MRLEVELVVEGRCKVHELVERLWSWRRRISIIQG